MTGRNRRGGRGGELTLALIQGFKRDGSDEDDLVGLLDQIDTDARDRVEGVIRERSDDPRWSMILSWVLLRRGRSEEALRLLEKLALLNPDDPELLRTFSMALDQNGEDALAKEVAAYAQSLTDDDGTSAKLLTGRAEYAGTQLKAPNFNDMSASVRDAPGEQTQALPPRELHPEQQAGDETYAAQPGAAEVLVLGEPVVDGRQPASPQRGSELDELTPPANAKPRPAAAGANRPFDFKTQARQSLPINEADIYGEEKARESAPKPAQKAREKAAKQAKRYETQRVKKRSGGAKQIDPPLADRRRAPGLLEGKVRIFLLAGVLFQIAVLAFGLWWWRTTESAANRAAEVQGLLAAGNLEQLAMQMPAVAANAIEDPVPVLILAEATLYRFYDAHPKRAARVRGWLGRGNSESEEALLARALLMPSLRRLQLLTDLEGAAGTPLLAWLLGSTQERLGAHQNAEAKFQRLADNRNAPAYLAATTLEYYGRQGDSDKVREIAKRLSRRAPDSAWQPLHEVLVQLHGNARNRPQVRAKTSGTVPPVVQGQIHLALARNAIVLHNLPEAASHLGLAADATQRQELFLLEYFDELMSAGFISSAREVLNESGFPRESPAGHASLGALLAAEGKLAKAQAPLLAAWKAGIRDPRTGRGLARAGLAGAPGETPVGEVLKELFSAWPDDPRITLLFSKYLISQGEFSRAAEMLEDQIHWFRRNADLELRAEAFYVLAQANRGRGEPEDALRNAKRVLKYQESHEGAQAMVDELSQAPKPRRNNPGRRR